MMVFSLKFCTFKRKFSNKRIFGQTKFKGRGAVGLCFFLSPTTPLMLDKIEGLTVFFKCKPIRIYICIMRGVTGVCNALNRADQCVVAASWSCCLDDTDGAALLLLLRSLVSHS